jgi:hypothetical protein
MDPRELEDLRQGLHSETADERAETLWAIARSPTGEASLLPVLEALLSDEAITVVALPRTYGEVRWAAAHALAAERKAAGLAEPVHLEQVLKPVASAALGEVRRAAGVDLPKSHGVAAEIFVVEELRRLGKLERYDLHLDV